MSHGDMRSPTLKGWISKATVDGLDPSQMQALMAEALATPAKVPYGNPPAAVPERDGERLAQVMITRTPPRVATQDDLLETMPSRDNRAEQEACRRSAGAGGGVLPPPLRRP